MLTVVVDSAFIEGQFSFSNERKALTFCRKVKKIHTAMITEQITLKYKRKYIYGSGYTYKTVKHVDTKKSKLTIQFLNEKSN